MVPARPRCVRVSAVRDGRSDFAQERKARDPVPAGGGAARRQAGHAGADAGAPGTRNRPRNRGREAQTALRRLPRLLRGGVRRGERPERRRRLRRVRSHSANRYQ